jgi:glucosyl-dolichyl phosphate glucuronosyltransferase
LLATACVLGRTEEKWQKWTGDSPHDATMKYSVVIPTHNRAHELRDTLTSLAAISTQSPWETIVVANNCTDDTADVVRQLAATFPAPLRLVHEAVPGRSAALNAGIGLASGEIILTLDDDMRVEADFLDRAGTALDELQCDYVGGRVYPIWRGTRPAWVPDRRSRCWAVVALADEGNEPFELTDRMPLGASMAFRRYCFDVAGLWDTRIGRKAGTLLGQEVREWCIRARKHGLRGFWTPTIMVRHVIHSDRLNKRYFRRWFYWRGVSRAILFQQHGLDMENPQGTTLDFANVPRVAGTPRYLFRTIVRTVVAVVRAVLRRDRVEAFEQELQLWMYAGIIRQRWRDRAKPFEWASPAENAGSIPA